MRDMLAGFLMAVATVIFLPTAARSRRPMRLVIMLMIGVITTGILARRIL